MSEKSDKFLVEQASHLGLGWLNDELCYTLDKYLSDG